MRSLEMSQCKWEFLKDRSYSVSAMDFCAWRGIPFVNFLWEPWFSWVCKGFLFSSFQLRSCSTEWCPYFHRYCLRHQCGKPLKWNPWWWFPNGLQKVLRLGLQQCILSTSWQIATASGPLIGGEDSYWVLLGISSIQMLKINEIALKHLCLDSLILDPTTKRHFGCV